MNTSTVRAERVVDCPFSVAHDYAAEYLRGAEHGGEAATLRAGVLRRHVLLRFGLRSDNTDSGRPNEEIVLHWSARTAALPNFAGTLRMRIDAPRTRLILEGTYVPPGGRLGTIFDRIAGRRLAAMTAADLLARLGDALAERERAWREAIAATS